MKYSPLDKLNLLVNIYGRMFSALIRFSTWSGFFILAILQAAGLYALSRFYLGGIYEIVYPVLSYFLPSALFHYPQYYLALPTVYSAYENFILGPTFWVILSAFAVFRLNGYYEKTKTGAGESLKIARRAYPRLLLIWGLETALILLVILVPTKLMASYAIGSPRIQMALDLFVQLLAFMVTSFLIYAIPGIVAGKLKFGASLRKSVKLCSGNFFLTYFIVLIPGSIRIIINLVLNKFSPKIIAALNPEIIVGLLFVQIFLGIFINLFIYGAAVFAYRELS